MERSNQGPHHTLLGHSPRDPFAIGNTPNKAAVDYSDVFGGPPRRFPGPGDAAVACALEDGERSRRWSSSVTEKPVYGGLESPAHRRHLGNDFFDDIFRGNESACPTPRRKDQDLFSPSTPGSRLLSPTRSLPPVSDMSGGRASVPAHLSHSSRSAISFDYPSFRFPTAHALHKHEQSIPDVLSVPPSPNFCAPATPNRRTRVRDFLRFDAHASFRRSPLSFKASHGNRPSETSACAKDSTDETEEQLKKDTSGSKAYSSTGHFHFSIYKWASKGVTLLTPSNLKERTKSGSRSNGISSPFLEQADLPPDDEEMLQETQALKNQSEMEDKSLFNELASAENDKTGPSNEATEPLSAASDIKSVLCDVTDTSVDTGLSMRDSTGFSEEEGKHKLKNLHHSLNENSDREGNKSITRQTKGNEDLVDNHGTVMKDGDDTAKITQENREGIILGCTEGASEDVHSVPTTLEDNILPSRAKGKVMEFMKVFNQEASQRAGHTAESRARRPKVKDKVKGRSADHASARVANADEEAISNYGVASSTPLASLKKADLKTSVKASDGENMDGPFPGTSGASVSLSDSNFDSLDASFYNVEEAHVENIEECLVEEFSQDHYEVTETDLHQEEIDTKMSDTRIQKWSKGKEGNIRSLLSTLQYILWPGSGWKPVPLVDIIEGSSVRRAYQKALLCLHPDKLQQKGAERYQKYIAEKVFDILQEGWDRFNSMSSL